MKRKLLILFLTAYTGLSAQTIIVDKSSAATYPLISASQTTAIYTDEADDWLVQKSAALLQQDLEKVTGIMPAIIHQLTTPVKNVIIIGTIGHSSALADMITVKKIRDTIKGKWDAYQIQTVQNPMKGVENALVICGSNKRGAAYGVFEIARQAGVSPWYWWGDVPVKKKIALYINKTSAVSGSPTVKYRGIFINDEAPAFSGWTKEKFGGVNHTMYEHMFELLLRLKGNYLWPAMWGNAFNDDDTLNPVMADKWGIVMGTSHHEPMLRAQQEWKRYGKGAWDYTKNDTTLRNFWRKGIQNMGMHESLVTVGMRGDGDMPMTQGTATELLERIVADQRKIITEVTGKPAEQTPQMWALYKEVQDYYDKGMRVPDDVTLLLCDDNWGNIRKLPKLTDKPRSGGYGIYYHFDYVGGPRNYKWINTNNIARVWEQMHLAYEYGVDKVWVVNVGDLKPMEFPISFFLDYAWDTKKWNEDNLKTYYPMWATTQFGDKYAKEIGDILCKYSQYAARVKPELLSAETYSLTNYNELDIVVKDFQQLLTDAEKVAAQLSAEYKDAYYELVLHPVKATANLYEMYRAVALNKSLAAQKSLDANKYADTVKELYQKDSLISVEYNGIAGGKWNHMMDQTHIGYTYWQQPTFNRMPAVKYVSEDSAQLNAYGVQEADVRVSSLASRSAIPKLFHERDGYVSMQAANYTKAVNGAGIQWKTIPDIGKDGDGVSSFPVTASAQPASANSPQLQYEIYTYDTGIAKLELYFSPTLPFNNVGLKYAVSVDDEKPQIINLHEGFNDRIWNKWVADNIIIQTSEHRISKPGKHTVKYWLVDPAIVLQKLIIDFGGVKPSYLGPPETAKK